jgi:hypothetical protein
MIDLHLTASGGDAYRTAGGVIERSWLPDMPHGFTSKPGTESDRALEIMKDFVLRQQSRPASFLR